MIKKLTALIIGLFLVAIGTIACGVSEDKSVPQSNQTNTQENTEMDKSKEKQVGKDVQKMKDEGVIDQNGRSAPGVDLRDYPGLG